MGTESLQSCLFSLIIDPACVQAFLHSQSREGEGLWTNGQNLSPKSTFLLTSQSWAGVGFGLRPGGQLLYLPEPMSRAGDPTLQSNLPLALW